MKGKARHDFFYWLGGVVFRPYVLPHKFNYEYDRIKVPYSPYIVVSNHLTNWDPLLVGLSFKKSMYYVSSDHILRLGLLGKLLNFAVAPIARAKTAQETQTVISIFRRLKEKCNICIFAEGTTSFDGKTGEIPYSLSKLAKKTGAALVTYRISGAYFSFPRWARFMRRGKMSGKLAQIYSPEQLKAMTEEEIYTSIQKDLYVNAYDDQKENPVAFYGKRPAEYLETILYCCPNCGKFSTLKSDDDQLFCSCGFHVRYNEYGYFELPGTSDPSGRMQESASAPAGSNEKPPFTTILDWMDWQKKEIEKTAAAMKDLPGDTPIFCDRDQILYQVKRASHNTPLARGTLCLYKDRLSIENETGEVLEFPLESVIEVNVLTMKTIIFSLNEKKIYEIHSESPRSALKYMHIFKAWQSVNKE